ncbi:HDL043Wp [Eremothecium sinecaudum]|uniref:HDL043Wp n=1 Tax=Eremothecium sinecaudum TaxID=45286 RepID=A0A109UZ43_9SACH|nr:HDL043Wp [Eremothecium sinecaudum]AMD20701.1 HDL043Wp [Eremothecium sinecaudum]
MSGVNKENYHGTIGTRNLKSQALATNKRAVLNNVTNTTVSQDSSQSNLNGSSSGYSAFGKVLRQAKSKLQTARGAGSLIPQAKRKDAHVDLEDKENISSLQASSAAVVAIQPTASSSTATSSSSCSSAAASKAITSTSQKHHLRSIVEETHEEYQSTLKGGDTLEESASATSTTNNSTDINASVPNTVTVAVPELIVSAPAGETKALEAEPLHTERKPFMSSTTASTTNSGVTTTVSISTTATTLGSGVIKAVHSQLRPNIELDVKKKRPISTVVEPEDSKKFKVCEKGHKYEWDDLDAEDINDPFMVSEYVNDIFEYLHKLEIMTLPNRHDLFKHANIQQNRDILVNWMVKIHNKFGLLPETLYLALNIMDRFLGRELVQLEKLQLVGTASLFIASKYEEVYSPSVKHFAYETDGACDEEEIKEGEKFILKTLQFNLNYPNPMNFLRRISKADDYDIQSRTLAKYLLEISVVDFKFIGILPSLCAAAAMFLSRKMLGKGKWDENLIHYSGGYTTSELAPVCNMLMEFLVQPVVHDELFKKYASRRFMKASVISRQWAKKVMSRSYDIMTLHEIAE